MEKNPEENDENCGCALVRRPALRAQSNPVADGIAAFNAGITRRRERILERAPTDPQARLFLALIQAASGGCETAIPDLAKAFSSGTTGGWRGLRWPNARWRPSASPKPAGDRGTGEAISRRCRRPLRLGGLPHEGLERRHLPYVPEGAVFVSRGSAFGGGFRDPGKVHGGDRGIPQGHREESESHRSALPAGTRAAAAIARSGGA